MFWFSFSRPRKIMWGLFWILLGLFLLLSNHGLLGYSFAFSRDWPILLIAWGLMKIIDLVAWRDARSPHKFKIIRGDSLVGDEEDGSRGSSFANDRAEIIRAVEEGRMTADEAAKKIRGV